MIKTDHSGEGYYQCRHLKGKAGRDTHIVLPSQFPGLPEATMRLLATNI